MAEPDMSGTPAKDTANRKNQVELWADTLAALTYIEVGFNPDVLAAMDERHYIQQTYADPDVLAHGSFMLANTLLMMEASRQGVPVHQVIAQVRDMLQRNSPAG